MKKIYIDPGGFYTKVYVLEHDQATGHVQFFGRSFFPSAATSILTLQERSLCYEHEGRIYLVGSDCNNALWDLDDLSPDGLRHRDLVARLLVRKALFDYTEPEEEIDLNILSDGTVKREIFEDLGAEFTGRLELAAYRGDKKITRFLNVKAQILAASEGVLGYIQKIKTDFSSAFLIDIGYRSTKMYVVTAKQGVEKFAFWEFGTKFYSEAILRALESEGLPATEPYWLMKQIELGCQSLDLPNIPPVGVSLIIENARWDTNKDFRRLTTDFITDYYNTNAKWVELLVITGGGALFNGELLSTSLSEMGYEFDDIYIDKSPLYTLIEGVVQLESGSRKVSYD